METMNTKFKGAGPDLHYKSCKIVDPVINDEGIIEAFVSVFGNVDSYGEIVDFGAFADSLKVKLPKGVWSHDWREPIASTLEAREVPAGDPMLPESIKQYGGLYIKGKIVLGVQRGREAYELIKEKVVDEFSIGYGEDEVEDLADGRHLKKLRLWEWSPVLVGANDKTALVGVKAVVPYANHGQADEGADWNGPAQMSACGDDLTKLKTICAWYDEENADVKSSYKLPHHEASDLKAVWKGVAAAMGAVLGSRGGVDIPEADKQGVYNHLAKHYKEFDKEVPEMKSYTEEELKQISESGTLQKNEPGKAIEALSVSDITTIRSAIKKLTEILDAAGTDNQVAQKVDTPEKGGKKISVTTFNQAIRQLAKARSIVKKSNL